MSEQIGNISEKLADLLSECTDDSKDGYKWERKYFGVNGVDCDASYSRGYLREIIDNSPKGIDVKVKRLHPDAVIPTKAHEHDAGFDLVAVEDVVIEPGETVLVKTGIAVELPAGYEMQIRQRSGITLKTKLRVQLGTVDSNYRGEIGVIVDNIADYRNEFGEETLRESFNTVNESTICTDGLFRNNSYIIRKGDRIAQAVIQRLPSVQFTEVEALGESDRGEGGFGSTGVTNTKG